jgi:hypothetical protein
MWRFKNSIGITNPKKTEFQEYSLVNQKHLGKMNKNFLLILGKN